jgi:5'-3' exonuclease
MQRAGLHLNGAGPTPSRSVSKGTVYLLDTSFFIFRAYHALPPLTTSKGLATGAVHGVSTMLEKLIRDKKPSMLGCCFDTTRDTFRRELFPAYKANRLEPEPDLQVQFPYVRRLIAALEIPCLDLEGYEADDILATLAHRYELEGHDVVLVTGDKDLMQCVTEHVWLYDPMRDQEIRRPEVFEKFGVGPESVADVLGLMGDTSDNIPGVKGVGPKTASALIARHPRRGGRAQEDRGRGRARAPLPHARRRQARRAGERRSRGPRLRQACDGGA